MRTKTDPTILKMALKGYEAERQKITSKIEEIQSVLNGGVKAVGNEPASKKPAKRKLSAATRAKLVANLAKARAARAARKAAPKKAAKRKLSAATRAQLAANLAKARKAKAAKGRSAKAAKKKAA